MNEIQKYFRYRQSLIDQYLKGDMTKSEYLEKNLLAVTTIRPEPFKNVDTIEKALLNYQYYNAMAKEATMSGKSYNINEERKISYDESNHYYRLKDKATLSVLRLTNYENIAAYFIAVNSKYLKGKLMEILVQDYEMILHSTSTLVLSNLRKEGVFEEVTKRSLIDNYINQRY